MGCEEWSVRRTDNRGTDDAEGLFVISFRCVLLYVILSSLRHVLFQTYSLFQIKMLFNYLLKLNCCFLFSVNERKRTLYFLGYKIIEFYKATYGPVKVLK